VIVHDRVLSDVKEPKLWTVRIMKPHKAGLPMGRDSTAASTATGRRLPEMTRVRLHRLGQHRATPAGAHRIRYIDQRTAITKGWTGGSGQQELYKTTRRKLLDPAQPLAKGKHDLKLKDGTRGTRVRWW